MSELIQTIDWDIISEPVQRTNGKIIKGAKVLVRNDNDTELAIHKSSYKELSNEEFISRVEGIQKVSGFNFEGYQELRGGNIILGYLKNDIESFEIGGNKIRDYLVIGNSHDTTTGFFLGTCTYLYRCENMFSHIRRFLTIRHTTKANEKMEEFTKLFTQYINARKVLYTKFNQFGEKIVSDKVREDMVKYVLSLHNLEKQEKELTEANVAKIDLVQACIQEEVNDLGNNLWALFNGITKYTTHHIESRTPVFGNTFGSKATINTRAFNFANEILAHGDAKRLMEVL